MTKDDKNETLRRRKYMREMMRMYRNEYKTEVRYLGHFVQHLEEQLEILKKKRNEGQNCQTNGLMRWKDVATALDEESNKSKQQNELLKSKVQEMSTIVREMKNWVSTFQQIQRMPNARCHTWKHSSLLSRPQSRQMGKEWITKQMYYNTEAEFHEYMFPTMVDREEFFDLDVEFTDTCYNAVFRRQNIEHLSFELICSLFRNDLCTLLCMNGFCIVEENTIVETTSTTSLHQFINSQNEWINLLLGEFHEDDRVVFVAQQIQDDESVENSNRLQRNRVIWVEIKKYDDGTIVRRFIYSISQSFNRHGYTSIQNDAKLWGLDLTNCPEIDRERRFRQLCRHIFTQNRIDSILFEKAKASSK